MARTLLIGADGYTSQNEGHVLKCCPWDKLRKLQNMSDFDTVVVNLLTLATPEKLDANAFQRAFTLKSMAEVLGHQGRIVVIGDPRKRIIPTDATRRSSEASVIVEESTALAWTKLGMAWDDRSGQSVTVAFEDYEDRNAYGRYLSFLNKYHFACNTHNPNLESLADAFGLTGFLQSNEAFKFSTKIDSFAQTRYGAVVAGAVRMSLIERQHGYSNRYGAPMFDTHLTFGPLVILPAVNLNDDEAIQVILEDVCGLDLKTDEPLWVNKLIAPGQEQIDSELAQIEGEIEELEMRRQKSLAFRGGVRKPLRLLYAQHRDLEVAVRSALEALGATIEHDEENSNDDGWLTVAIDGRNHHGVLEIKGTTKDSFNEYGLKQLDGWISDSIDARGVRPKGIFVGNSSVTLPVAERPIPFGGNFTQNAEMRGVVVIRSQDLFECLRRLNDGEFNTDEFWGRIFSHVGVISLDSLLANGG